MRGPGRYTKEFKLEAIRLLDSGDKPVSEIAMELGVKRTLLYRWRDQVKESGDLAPAFREKNERSPVAFQRARFSLSNSMMD